MVWKNNIWWEVYHQQRLGIMGKVSKRSYPSHHAHFVGRRLGNEAAAIYYANRSDEGLTLETSAFLPFTVANLRFQLSC